MSEMTPVQAALYRKARLRIGDAGVPVVHRGQAIPAPGEGAFSLRGALRRSIIGGMRGMGTAASLTPDEAAYDPLLGGIVGGLRGIGVSMDSEREDARYRRREAGETEDRMRRHAFEDEDRRGRATLNRLKYGFDPAALEEDDFQAISRKDMVEGARDFQERQREDRELERRRQESLIDQRRQRGVGDGKGRRPPPTRPARFRSPDEVREAVKGGRVPRAEGLRILREQFGFE